MYNIEYSKISQINLSEIQEYIFQDSPCIKINKKK
jgi:hypothetical protein